MPAAYRPDPNSPSLATWSATENAAPQVTLRVISFGMLSFVGDWVANSRIDAVLAAAFDHSHGQLGGAFAVAGVLEQLVALVDRAHQRVQPQRPVVRQPARHLRRPSWLRTQGFPALLHLVREIGQGLAGGFGHRVVHAHAVPGQARRERVEVRGLPEHEHPQLGRGVQRRPEHERAQRG